MPSRSRSAIAAGCSVRLPASPGAEALPVIIAVRGTTLFVIVEWGAPGLFQADRRGLAWPAGRLFQPSNRARATQASQATAWSRHRSAAGEQELVAAAIAATMSAAAQLGRLGPDRPGGAARSWQLRIAREVLCLKTLLSIVPGCRFVNAPIATAVARTAMPDGLIELVSAVPHSHLRTLQTALDAAGPARPDMAHLAGFLLSEQRDCAAFDMPMEAGQGAGSSRSTPPPGPTIH